MVLREVLQLYEPSRPTAAAICAVELKHSVRTAVSADSVLHSLIFLDGGFRKLLTEFQDFRKLRWSGFQQFRNRFLSKRVCFKSVFRKPLFHLLNGVRIVKRGKRLHFR